MKKSILALLMVLVAIASGAQTTQKLTATKASEYGLIYRLPLTEFDVTLEAECTIERPGEFYQYARIYLGSDPIMKASQSWRLKSAVINPVAVPDPEQEYLVQFKSGNTVFVTATAESIPLAINTAEVVTVTPMPLPKAVAIESTVLESPAAAYAITEDMAAGTSLAKRAELAAAKIFEIRATRNEIISGQSDNMPSDGAAMKLALDNLAQQEAVLTAMFLGTRQQCTQVSTFRYAPETNDDASRIVIARISALKGIVDPTDLSGDPVYLSMKVDERGALPVNEKGVEKTWPKGGVAYRIPGRATIDVSYDGKTYARATYAVAQLGVTFGIDPGLFSDKKAPNYLIFDPLTGAIRELAPVE